MRPLRAANHRGGFACPRSRVTGLALLRWLLRRRSHSRRSAQTLGEGGSAAQGSAGPGGAQNASAQLEKCDAPKGTLAVVEAQSQVIASLGRYGLQSPTGLIRMIVQQSNCFQVVERGVAMQNMMQERALAAGGQMQSEPEHRQGPDGRGRLHRHPERGLQREQRRRRGRRHRWPARPLRRRRGGGRRGGRRAEVQGSADQHAAGRHALGDPGRRGRRQRQADRLRARRHPVRRRRRRGAGRLHQHQRGQGHHRVLPRQLEQHRARDPQQPEPDPGQGRPGGAGQCGRQRSGRCRRTRAT